jgi:hypothetical protein
MTRSVVCDRSDWVRPIFRTLLNQFGAKRNPAANKANGHRIPSITGSSSDGFEGDLTVGMRIGPAVRASRTAGLGASAQRFIDDGLDGARAAATFGAAPKAAIELLGIAGKIVSNAHCIADVVVGQDVAGTNDHENGELFSDAHLLRYLRLRRDAKGKA